MNKTEFNRILKDNKLTPVCWKLHRELENSIIVIHKVSGTVKVLEK